MFYGSKHGGCENIFCYMSGKILKKKSHGKFFFWGGEVMVFNATFIPIMLQFYLTPNYCWGGRVRMAVGYISVYTKKYVRNQCLSPLRLVRLPLGQGDVWQVGGFLRVLRFPPPIILTATI
jgi:hypothetical protein